MNGKKEGKIFGYLTSLALIPWAKSVDYNKTTYACCILDHKVVWAYKNQFSLRYDIILNIFDQISRNINIIRLTNFE